MNKSIWELHCDQWRWDEIQAKNKFRDRYCHQAVNWQGNLLVFGGQFGYNAEKRKRECTKEIFLFDFKTQKWRELETRNCPSPRRNFGCTVMGDKYVVVYGGLEGECEFLNDISFLNMDTLEWEKKSVENDIDG